MNLFGADTPVKVCPGCKGYGSCPECDPRLSPADDYLTKHVLASFFAAAKASA